MKRQLQLAAMFIVIVSGIAFLYAECEDAIPWNEFETICSYEGDTCNIWQSSCNLYCRWWPLNNCGPTETQSCRWRMFTGKCVRSSSGYGFDCVGTWGEWTDYSNEQENVGSSCLF